MSLESQITAVITRIATEFKTVRGEATRKIFPTYSALNLYSAPIGTLGYVVDEDAEYICRANGWNLWNKKETVVNPSIVGGVALGAGANAAVYSVSSGMATMHHKLYLSTGSSIGGRPRFTLPLPSPTTRIIFGSGRAHDASADKYYPAAPYITGSVVFVDFVAASAAYATIDASTGAIPFTWAGGDSFEYSISWLL